MNVEPTMPLIAGMFEMVTVLVGTADAGAARPTNPATAIARATVTAVHLDDTRVNPRAPRDSLRPALSIVSPVLRDTVAPRPSLGTGHSQYNVRNRSPGDLEKVPSGIHSRSKQCGA